jgi:tRNA-dihydrouridine synthase B
VPVPVTVQMRTGPAPATRNAERLARDFERAGAAMIAVHGRTRACAYGGDAEYATIAAVKAAVSVPVVANGDIAGPHKALEVLRLTGADAVMIGRAAQGRPWIFREIAHFLDTGCLLAPPETAELRSVLRAHLLDHYAFHGELTGVRTARKHVGWYLRAAGTGTREFIDRFNRLERPEEQLDAIDRFLVEPACRAVFDDAVNDKLFRRSHQA